MDEVYEILLEISMNPNTSNRKLARTIHKAVGTVNARIHELMASNKLIVVKDDAHGFTYALTQEGKSYLAMLLHQEVTRSLNTVDLARQKIRFVLNERFEQGKRHFYLYGQDDSVCRLLKMALIELSLEQSVTYSFVEAVTPDLIYNDSECLLIWENQQQQCHPLAVHVLI